MQQAWEGRRDVDGQLRTQPCLNLYWLAMEHGRRPQSMAGAAELPLQVCLGGTVGVGTCETALVIGGAPPV